MRKKLVIMLAGLLTVLSMGFGAAQFSDVPAGHWAQEAVEAITGRGIIVGFPDGTFRGNENLTRYQAALIIYRLLQQLEAEKGTGPATDAVQGMTDEEKAALQNAIQELAAELAALGVRVSALEDNAATKDDVAALQAQIDELKAGMAPAEDKGALDQQALQDLADRVEAASVAADTALAQSQELGERLDAVEGDLAALKSEIEAGSDSISALNELAVLLNQDVLSLQDRVTALEKAIADIQGQEGPDLTQFATLEDVAALQEFASALRTDLVALSEKVSALETAVAGLDKRVATLESNAFTISGYLQLTYQVKRVWGVYYGTDGTDANTTVDYYETVDFLDVDRLFSNDFSSGDVDGDGLVVDDVDLGGYKEGATSADFQVNFNFRNRTAVSDPGKLNSYPDLIKFSIRGTASNTDNDGDIDNSDTRALALRVNGVSTVLRVAEGQVLTFTFGTQTKPKFTEYVFDNDTNSRGPGFIATGPFLLGGTTTVAYGSTGGANGDNKYFRAARATFGLGPISLGASFAQEGVDQVPLGGTEQPPITAYGFDAKLGVGPITLTGEYFGFSQNIGDPSALSDSGFYVKADAALGILNLSASYRSIGDDITPANMLSGDAGNWFNNAADNAAPFAYGQNGFGVSANTTLGPIKLSGYFQQYTFAPATPEPGDHTAFGVTAGLGLGPISLEGFYRSASLNGTPARSIQDEKPGDGTYSSSFGVRATAALGPANLTAFYTSYYTTNTSSFGVYGNADLDLGVAKVKAIGRFVDEEGSQTLKYGAQLETQPLFFGISLFGNGVSRTTSGTNTTEGKFAVGIKINQFLFANSSLTVAYGGYGGQNIASVLTGATDKAWDPADNRIYNAAGAASGEAKGIYFTWTYWDLTFSYADLDVNNTGALTHVQSFKISYRVNF